MREGGAERVETTAEEPNDSAETFLLIKWT